MSLVVGDQRLDRFLAGLPEGFRHGVRERLELRRLLLGLAASGDYPSDPAALKTLLAPLVCSSRDQQREFYRLFDAEWGKPSVAPEGEGGGKVVPPPRFPWAALATVVVLILIGIAAWRWRPRDVDPPDLVAWTPSVPDCWDCSTIPKEFQGKLVATTGAPISGADVWVPGQHQTTRADGSFQFRASNAAVPILAAHPDYRSSQGMVPRGARDPLVTLEPIARPLLANVGALTPSGTASLLWVRDPAKVAVSPNGDVIAVAARDRTVRVYSVASSKEVARSSFIADATLLAFSPDGTSLAVGTSDQMVQELRAPDWRPVVGFLPAPTRKMTALASSDIGIVTGYADGRLIEGKGQASTGEAINALAVRTVRGSRSLIAVTRSSFFRFPLPLAGPVDGLQLFPTGGGPPVEELGFDADANFMAIRRQGGPVGVWYGYGQQVEAPADWPTEAAAFALSQSSRLVWIATTDRSLASKLRPLRWLAAVLPAIAIAGWIWWLYWNRSRLNRLQLDRDMVTQQFTPPKPEPLFRDRRTQALAREMRSRKPAPSLDLAPEPTVLRTAKSAGFLTPVFAAPTRQREFLVLLKRDGAGDQQERLYSALTSALKDQHAFIDLYTFHGSPVTIRDHSGGWTDLKELAARHPEHDVWIIADPAELLQGWDGTPDWTRELSRWQDCAVLSPVDVDDRTRALFEAEGVRVGSASGKGLAAALAPTEVARSGQASVRYPFPRPLRRIPLRWVEQASPGDRPVKEVMAALPEYLGADGMLLAAACSVYPETFWGLTLWLAQKLASPADGGQSRMEEALVRLTSLPWFRYGRIPDWMRARLVNRLASTDGERVRKAVEEFLTKAVRGDGELIIARGERGDSAPVRDYVMFSFLLGRKIDESLAPKPPSVWLRMLFEGGRYVFGPRLWLHGGAALLLGACAWLAADSALDLVPTQVKLAAWKLPDPAPVPKPAAVRELASDPMRRAMVAVADSLVGSSAAAFEATVAGRAALFVIGTERVPRALETQRAAAGLAFKGGYSNRSPVAGPC